MVGKKNIVFGFLYLVLTAALGPVMIFEHFDAVGAAEAVKQEKVGALQQMVADGYEIDLETVTAETIAKTNSEALLALSARLNSRAPIDELSGNPHAHGNLEALLNIAVGLLLAFVAVPVAFKQTVSWLFIAGALLHSGLLYLTIGLGLPFAVELLGSWFGYLGPVALLLGLLLAGVAAAIGYRATPVYDAGRIAP